MKPYLALRRPWLVAHRGGALEAPENTLAAFERAVALGADALELDVHLTRDGELVVFHDDETTRLTGEPGTIEARTLAQVGRLDAGYAFTPDGGRTFPWRGRGLAPPTLREVLARLPVRMNVEVKGAEPEAAEALAAAVKAAGALDRVCLGSERDAQGERIRRLLPGACHFLPGDAATVAVMASRVEGATGWPEGWDVADLPYRLDGLAGPILDEASIARMHARGLAVFAWTVDDEADMRALLVAGVDGIMTDRPSLLARVMERAPA